jgi:hypothetical protein
MGHSRLTLTQMRPCGGRGNGREIVELNSAHAVSSHLIKFDRHIDVQFVCDPDIIWLPIGCMH